MHFLRLVNFHETILEPLKYELNHLMHVTEKMDKIQNDFNYLSGKKSDGKG